MWGTTQKKTEATVKQALTQAPALRLPDPEKAFQLFVHEKEGKALRMLTQRFESEPKSSLIIQRLTQLLEAGLPAFEILQLLQS